MDKIKVNRGTVEGVGRIKILKSEDVNYELPILYFINIQEEGGEYICTNISLHIDGYGQTMRKAEDDMARNVLFFLKQNFSKLEGENRWLNLLGLLSIDEWSTELWDAYSETQLLFAREKPSTEEKPYVICDKYILYKEC